MYFVNHPDGVRQVLQTNHKAYGKRTVQYDALALVTGRGLLTNDGDSWLRQRRLTQPAFHPQRLAELEHHVAAAALQLDAEWSRRSDGDVVDVDAAMMRAALDVVGRALFSADFTAAADRITGAVLAALDVVVARARSPVRWPLAVPTPANLRLRRAVSVIDESVAALVAQRRRHPGSGADLLDAYLGAEVDGIRMADEQVRDEVVTLLVAGHETVASSLAWTWLLLARNPQVQERLQHEVDAVLGGRQPSYDDVPSLAWTGQVVEEALRLYPPAWVVTRRAIADDVVLAHRVPAESLVILSPWVTQRDAQWWDQPRAFRPERFAAAERAQHVRGAYFPFGAGPNLCIGRDFALVESVLFVASMAQRYAFEAIAGHAVHPDPLVTIRPRGGLPLRLRHR